MIYIKHTHTTHRLIEMDPVLARIAKYKEILKRLHAHIEEFWGQPLDVDADYKFIHNEWLLRYIELNEERVAGTGLSDLLFVIRCYISVIQNHDKVKMKMGMSELCKTLTEVKLLAVQNTQKSRHYYLTHDQIRELELRVATFVVFDVSRGPKVLELEMEQHGSEPLPVDLQERVAEVRCVKFQPPIAEALKDGIATPAKEVEPGIFWLPGNSNTLRWFVPICGRVLNKIYSDLYILSSLEKRVLTNEIRDSTFSGTQRGKLFEWLKAKSQLQTTNEFFTQFRGMVFEDALPMNCVSCAISRKSSKTNRITAATALLSQECGFQPLNRLNTLVGNDLKEIAGDPNHELHQLLLLMMFSHILNQTSRVKFICNYFVPNQHTITSAELKQFQTKRKWGQNQRPVVVELQRKLYVLDIDPKGEKIEHIKCADMYEALLYWVFLMKTKYQDKLLLCSTNIRRFYDPIFSR